MCGAPAEAKIAKQRRHIESVISRSRVILLCFGLGPGCLSMIHYSTLSKNPTRVVMSSLTACSQRLVAIASVHAAWTGGSASPFLGRCRAVCAHVCVKQCAQKLSAIPFIQSHAHQPTHTFCAKFKNSGTESRPSRSASYYHLGVCVCTYAEGQIKTVQELQ